MKAAMRGSYFGIFCSLAAGLILAGCSPSRQIKSVVRNDLFSLDYGLSENQIALSAGNDDSIDMVMQEGIFHVLDGSGKKIMKLSSYGDLLALLYDPSRSPVPRIMKPAELPAPDAPADASVAPGRYALPLHFVAPGRMAVDGNQTIYVIDRVANPSARIFDPNLASYCDRIIRRFGAQGSELPYIGQEGPGGSPFPFVMAVEAFGDDTFAVVSSSESVIQIHHFGKAGNLLSSLRLNRESLTLPDELAGAEEQGTRLHASLDGIMGSSAGAAFEITMKIDYYREHFNPGSFVISRTEFAGSWLIVVDGMTGRQKNSLVIAPEGQDSSIPELVGSSPGFYYLLSKSPREESGAEVADAGMEASSMVLQRIDTQGKVDLRYQLDFPEGTREVVVLKVSAAGQAYALLRTDESVKVVWWEYR